MIFWNDTITVTNVLSGPTTLQITNNGGPNTVIGVAMQQSNNSSATQVKCDNDLIAQNYATNFSNVLMNYQCDGDIEISKTGQDEATVIVSYIPDRFTGDSSTTTQISGYNPATSISSSSDINVYGSMSAGEVMIGFILILQIVLLVLYSAIKSLQGINTTRKYINYSNGDVPISKEL